MFWHKKCCCIEGHKLPDFGIKIDNIYKFITNDSSYFPLGSFDSIQVSYVCSRCHAMITEEKKLTDNVNFIFDMWSAMNIEIKNRDSAIIIKDRENHNKYLRIAELEDTLSLKEEENIELYEQYTQLKKKTKNV